MILGLVRKCEVTYFTGTFNFRVLTETHNFVDLTKKYALVVLVRKYNFTDLRKDVFTVLVKIQIKYFCGKI